MKKAKFLLLTLLSVLGMNTAWAETVLPYEVDFNEAIPTSSVHDFAVSTNWGHIVGTYIDDYWDETYYMSYSYRAGEGIDGSGTLIAYKQYAGDNWNGATVYDLLVTPQVSGTITMMVKPSGDPSFVEFYNVDATGKTRGSLIQRFNSDEYAESTVEGWYTVSITLPESGRVGIRAQYVYMDNFSATSAEIVKQKALAITGLTNVGSGTYMPTQNEDGSVDISLKVTLKNTGDIDLKSGDENYTLSLVKREYYSSTITEFDNVTFAINQDIPAGETATFEAKFTAPSDLGIGWMYLKVKENITGTISSAMVQTQVQEYTSKFIFNVAGTSYGNSPSSTTTPIDFGKVTESASVLYEIYNAGAAPLKINSITIDEPFTVELDETVNWVDGVITIPGQEKINLLITLPLQGPQKDEPLASNSMRRIVSSGTPGGIYDGNITIEYTNFGKETSTYMLGVSGTIIDSSKNFITFSNADNTNGQFPEGSIHPDEVYISSNEVNGETNYYLTSTYESTKKFITPMLTATAGESFTYDAWFNSSNYNSNPTVIVYISKDRINWTQVDKQTKNELGSSPKTFIVTIEEPGDYYIAFEPSGSAMLDDIYGLTPKDLPEHDWYVIDSNLPTTATQNNPYTATISVKNINPEADAITTATLYVGGEAVAVEENVALEGNDKTAAEGTGRSPRKCNIDDPVEITLTFNPHITGEQVAYIELKNGDTTILTQEVTVNIAEEEKSAELTVDGTTNRAGGPIYTWDKNSEVVSLYSAAVLKEEYGLNAGDVISSIIFKGYNDAGEHTTSLDVWYEWTDDTEQTKPADGLYDVTGMTSIISEEEHIWAKEGSSTDLKDLIVLNFDNVEYQEGKALRVVARDYASAYKDIKWETSEIANLSFKHSSDYTTTFEGNAWSAQTLPVIHINLVIEAKTLSGTVTDVITGEPIEGATVTLRNEQNDVEYAATTSTDGSYTINVIQDNLTYTVTVEAEGYITDGDDEELSFEQSQEYDFALYPENPVYPTVTVTISDSEYATLYYEDKYLGIPDGVKAYTAKVDGKNIVLTEVTDFIPAGKPVIINGPQGEYEFEVLPMAAPGAGAIFAELGLFETGVTYNNGATIGEESVTVELGNDRNTKPYDVKLGTAKAYCANLFGQIVDVENDAGEVEQKTRVVYVTGGNNPKDGALDDTDKSTGNGYKPESMNLPQSGCYYMITPNTAGHITAYIILNPNKNFYVVKGSDGECLPVSALTLKADGDTPTDVTLKDDYTVETKLTGTVEFDVEADETYYMFATGSKLSFGGYLFVSSDEEDDPDNDLIGTEEDLTITNDAAYKYYVLSWKDANKNKDELGFYFWSGSNDGHSMQLGAHKAYIKRPADAANNKGYMFWLPDAIEGITMDALTNADAIYTLSGIRVNANNLKKGIYIVNGKKVVIK